LAYPQGSSLKNMPVSRSLASKKEAALPKRAIGLPSQTVVDDEEDASAQKLNLS
jgi:hypothetical protein